MLDCILKNEAELVRLRRDIHAHPELGNCEERTSALVAERLERAGLSVRRAAGTGIIASLRGERSGRTLVLRADMDCLPLTERTGLPYASERAGLMHACGHDIHTAALVGCAEALAQRRGELCGEVRFVFQPDEEGDGGAARLVAEGCMDGADAVFGCHVDPHIAPGRVGIRYGKFYAASNPFDVTVRGRTAHAAQPEAGVDAIYAAAMAVAALRELRSRESAAGEKCIISVGTIGGGTGRNIICGECSFSGVIRTLGAEARARIVREAEETVKKAASLAGASADWRVTEGYGGIVNDDGAVDIVRAAAEKALGREKVELIAEPLMTTEDFGCYGERAPCCFFHVGAGGSEPLHSPRFAPDESAIAVAASVLTQAALDFCSEN
ncbi:MAG: M20 family metallopeptidase [Oscillospiraceae bacterium]|nr:M20 family metallopeptidase [Oscillospiraceae bacterium]